jgi:hypothetical protein
VTNTGASGTMKLSVDPPGAAKMDQTELTLDHGKSATVTITPLAVSKAPNDVTIKATYKDKAVGSATLTVVSVVIPTHIRNKDTPQEMKPDRIPPRQPTVIPVEVTPDLTGSGQSVTLVVKNQSADNGLVSLNDHNLNLVILKSGDVALKGTSQTKETADYTARNAGKLELVVQVRGKDTVESKGFSVAAIPLNMRETLTQGITSGRGRGIYVQDTFDSDSGNIHDLTDVQYKEQVETKEQDGVFKGQRTRSTGYGDAVPGTTDAHVRDISFLQYPGGKWVLEQTHEFRDRRTGAQDIPMANSGFTLQYIVYGHAHLNPWYLLVVEEPQAGTANNITSGAGETFIKKDVKGTIQRTFTNP